MKTAIGQLAWAEGRRLFRNPVLWVSLLPLANWVRVAERSTEGEDQLMLLVGFGLGFPGLVLVVAMVLAVLRPRLEHTEPLLGTLAVGPDRRSVGHSLSALAGGAFGLLLTALLLFVFGYDETLGVWSNEGQSVTVPRPNFAQLLQGPLAVVVLLVFVVALVRWVPSWLVIIPIALAIGMQLTFFGLFHSISTKGQRWLFPLNTGIVHGEWKGGCTDDSPCYIHIAGFDSHTAWWHLGYLTSLAVLFATIAVLRHRRDRVAWTWFAAAMCGAIAFAAAQFAAADVYPS